MWWQVNSTCRNFYDDVMQPAQFVLLTCRMLSVCFVHFEHIHGEILEDNRTEPP